MGAIRWDREDDKDTMKTHFIPNGWVKSVTYLNIEITIMNMDRLLESVKNISI